MRLAALWPVSVVILVAGCSMLDAGDHNSGVLQRLTDKYHRHMDNWRRKWTRGHRAVKNGTYYCECPPYWMENYGYYQTRWRKLSPDAVQPIPDPNATEATPGTALRNDPPPPPFLSGGVQTPGRWTGKAQAEPTEAPDPGPLVGKSPSSK